MKTISAVLGAGWTAWAVRLVVCLACMVALVGFPVATVRKHCPKAAVQLVVDYAPDGTLQHRAPQKGDSEFEPCRCAARAAAEASASREASLGSAATFVLLLPGAPVLDVPALVWRPAPVIGFDLPLPEGRRQAPLTPPPISA